MSVNKRKQIILKNKLKTQNKYAGTGNQTEENVISEVFKCSANAQVTNPKINTFNTEHKSLEQQVFGNNNIIDELKQELISLKVEYESEKLKSVEQFREVKNELEEKNRISKVLMKDNYKLINKLKNIESELKGIYLKSINEKILKKKMANISKEQTLKSDICVADEEIKNTKKFALAEKKLKRQLENLLYEVNNGLEENKNNDLKDLNMNINTFTEEIEELSKIKSVHKNCERNIQNLKNKLNLIQTQFEFESKKNNMLSNQSSKKTNKSYVISNKNENSRYSENVLITNQNNYSKNIRKIILNTKSPKVEKLNLSTVNHVKQQFNYINKIPKSIPRLIISTNQLASSNKNLFSKDEYNVLKEVIPSKYMNKYMYKYESKKTENDEIKNKFTENSGIKIKNQEQEIKLDYVEIKIKEAEKKHFQLLLKFRTNDKKIKDLTDKIKICQKDLDKYSKIIAREEKTKNILLGYKQK